MISWYALDKNPMTGHLFEGNPVDEGTTQRGTDTRELRLEFPRETGLILKCPVKVGNPLQTKQGK